LDTKTHFFLKFRFGGSDNIGNVKNKGDFKMKFKFFTSEDAAFNNGAHAVYNERIVGKSETMLTYRIFKKARGEKRYKDTGDRRVAGRGDWQVTDTSHLPKPTLPEAFYDALIPFDAFDPKTVFIGEFHDQGELLEG
jgi:hypothetical protein